MSAKKCRDIQLVVQLHSASESTVQKFISNCSSAKINVLRRLPHPTMMFSVFLVEVDLATQEIWLPCAGSVMPPELSQAVQFEQGKAMDEFLV